MAGNIGKRVLPGKPRAYLVAEEEIAWKCRRRKRQRAGRWRSSAMGAPSPAG